MNFKIKKNKINLNKTNDYIYKNSNRKIINCFKPLLSSNNNNIINITSKSYIVFNRTNKKIIFEKNINNSYKIASLTKLMTLLIIIELIEKLKINPKDYLIRVNKNTVKIKGTTANLKLNEYYSLYDLLFGMMLPSGNDASFLLAESIIKIYFKININKKKIVNYQEYFVQLMNNKANKLNLKNTKFKNPHGMDSYSSKSSVNDVCKIIDYGYNYDLFRDICSTKIHKCIYYKNNKTFIKIWENTNKSLNNKNCIGGKTGITPKAGPCLSTIWKNENLEFIIIILNCNNMELRFKEVEKLYNNIK